MQVSACCKSRFAFGVFHLPVMLQQFHSFYCILPLGLSSTTVSVFLFCLWGFPPPASHVATVSQLLLCLVFGVFHHLPVMLQQFHSFYSVLPFGVFHHLLQQFLQCFAFGVFHHLPIMLQQFHNFYSVLPLGFSTTTVSFSLFCLRGFPPPASHVATVSQFSECFALGGFQHSSFTVFTVLPLGFSATCQSCCERVRKTVQATHDINHYVLLACAPWWCCSG